MNKEAYENYKPGEEKPLKESEKYYDSLEGKSEKTLFHGLASDIINKTFQAEIYGSVGMNPNPEEEEEEVKEEE
jgi:hypothetical protein